MARNSQYSGGSGTNPSVFARGETVSQAPAATMIKELNFRTRLSESIYLFFNNKRLYFAMQVATVPHKLGVDL